MPEARKGIIQILGYTAFMVVVGYFSAHPVYRHIEADQALVVISFQHATQPLEACRQASAEELAELPPNMRQPTICARARSPLRMEVLMDGEPLFQLSRDPPGLFSDGSITIHATRRVATGKHLFELKLNDNIRHPDESYTHREEVELQSTQILVIRFSTQEGFVLE